MSRLAPPRPPPCYFLTYDSILSRYLNIITLLYSCYIFGENKYIMMYVQVPLFYTEYCIIRCIFFNKQDGISNATRRGHKYITIISFDMKQCISKSNRDTYVQKPSLVNFYRKNILLFSLCIHKILSNATTSQSYFINIIFFQFNKHSIDLFINDKNLQKYIITLARVKQSAGKRPGDVISA